MRRSTQETQMKVSVDTRSENEPAFEVFSEEMATENKPAFEVVSEEMAAACNNVLGGAPTLHTND